MTGATIDPDLPGIWIIPGEPETYEILGDGTYHVAAPEAPVAFHRGGWEMTWGEDRLKRHLGSGETVEGVWHDPEREEEWFFRPDGTYTLHWPDGDEAHGIWALRDDGASLWTREFSGLIATTGVELTFHLESGIDQTFGYTVKNDIWSLLDPETWKTLVDYRRP